MELLFKSTGLSEKKKIPNKQAKTTNQLPNICINGITQNTGSDTLSFARQNGLEYFSGSHPVRMMHICENKSSAPGSHFSRSEDLVN